MLSNTSSGKADVVPQISGSRFMFLSPKTRHSMGQLVGGDLLSTDESQQALNAPEANQLQDLAKLPTRPDSLHFTQQDLQAEFVKLADSLHTQLLEMADLVRKGVKEDITILCEDWRRPSTHTCRNGEKQADLDLGPLNSNSSCQGSPCDVPPRASQKSPSIRRFRRSGSVTMDSLPTRAISKTSHGSSNQFLNVCPHTPIGGEISDAVAITSDDQHSKAPVSSVSCSSHIHTHKRRVSNLQTDVSAALQSVNSTGNIPRLLRIVSHPLFDYCVATMILLNGVLVGVQTDYLARSLQETPPAPFQVLEIIFCIIFTSEVALRLWAFRCGFFTRGGKGWNVFDLIIVSLQLMEIFLGAVSDGLGFSFNLLRILRLIRIVRLARALRLIGELRTIVSSIAGSLKPLFWTGVLLLMVIYVLGVYVTQVVLNKRMTLEAAGGATPMALDIYWGSLLVSIFSLFESITGGVDWDQVVRPLIQHVGPEMAVLYCLYIMFTCFAMLNVVTGVFIESVMKNAKEENEQRTRNQISSLFTTIDLELDGEISWEDFEKQLDRREMRQFFKTIDVDISNARSLFDLLDVDEKGVLQFEEFMDGCLRIWSPSSGLDLRMIRRDLSKLNALLRHVAGALAHTAATSARG